jgi:hypothetical protein
LFGLILYAISGLGLTIALALPEFMHEETSNIWRVYRWVLLPAVSCSSVIFSIITGAPVLPSINWFRRIKMRYRYIICLFNNFLMTSVVVATLLLPEELGIQILDGAAPEVLVQSADQPVPSSHWVKAIASGQVAKRMEPTARFNNRIGERPQMRSQLLKTF